MSYVQLSKHAIVVFAIILSLAFNATSTTKDSIDIQFHGFAALDEGQIIKGLSNADPNQNQGPYSHIWQQRLFMQLGFTVNMYERFKLILNGEGSLSFSLRRYNDVPATLQPLFSFYPVDAAGALYMGDVQDPWMEFKFGYFTYKYNTNSWNLGEYMFRSGTYPQWIKTDFEYSMARLLGCKVNLVFFDKAFRNDLLLTSEVNMWPYQDFSISYLTGYNMKNYFEIGAGIHFNHLWSVKKEYTTPEHINNRFITSSGDTSYYTFKGTKLMGQVAINFKQFIPFLDKYCGKHECKIYGEVGVLGLKDYINHITVGDTLIDSLGNVVIDPYTGLPVLINTQLEPDPDSYYDNLRKRIPVMFGFTFPTFKLFDVLAIEFEYFPGKFPNISRIAENMDEGNLPVPFVPPEGSEEADWNPWKWSIYCKRTFGNHFAVSALFSRDHMRPITHHPGNRQDKGDFLTKGDHWWWVLRLKTFF